MLWLILSLLLLTGITFGQGYGSISGTVIDASGRPVPNAHVFAHPLGVQMATAIPQEETDAIGGYVFKRLSYGHYALSAAKPEDDYPVLYLGFYGGFEKQPEAGVSENSPRQKSTSS